MSMPPMPGNTPAPKILVVDDEPEVRAAVEDGLAVEGYAVRGAADGLAAFRRSPPGSRTPLSWMY